MYSSSTPSMTSAQSRTGSSTNKLAGSPASCRRAALAASVRSFSSHRGGRLVIVDTASLSPAPAGQIGEVWLSGPSVAIGYWGRPTETAALFKARLADGSGPYRRIGDLGLMDDGQALVVAGRLKDLIILRGRNVYPQDVKQVVEDSHDAVRAGCAVAFSVLASGEDRLVIIVEVTDGPAATRRCATGWTGTSPRYISASAQRLYNPAASRDAGIDQSYAFQNQVLADPVRAEYHEAFFKRITRFMVNQGITPGRMPLVMDKPFQPRRCG
jgi:acyl-CoA synthetase (AMP-forming)/AMP-acid ligase II